LFTEFATLYMHWWATDTFKVATLPLPLLKKKKSKVTATIYYFKKIVVGNFAL